MNNTVKKSDAYLEIDKKHTAETICFLKKVLSFAVHLIISGLISLLYVYFSVKIVFSAWDKNHPSIPPQSDAPDVSGFVSAILDFGLVSVFSLIILVIVFFTIRKLIAAKAHSDLTK